MAARSARPTFSVIIPFEFHRGIASQCLKGWCESQDFPRERYEIILAVPEGAQIPELREARAQLAPWDRVIVRPAHHDMDLVAETAGHARGEIMVFTEAHCIPQPDFLSAACDVMDKHPEWAGFSGASRPITHNALSEVEAAMYSSAIKRNVEEHPWLKALDQCLVLRRSAYTECGGIESKYGHFAEWLLSARLNHSGLKMGHDPAAAVSHYYIGEFEDIMVFTEDFARGHMRFAMNGPDDPCARMLDSPACWEDRAGYERAIALHMVKLLWRARGHVLKGTHRAQWRARLRMWLRRLTGGVALEWRRACRNTKTLRRKTEKYLLAGEAAKPQAQQSFLNLILACGAKGQLSLLRESRRGSLPQFLDGLRHTSRSGQWLPGQTASVIQAGFYSRVSHDDRAFCWTHPEAMVWLPLKAGRHRVRIRWIEFNSLPGLGRYHFYHDESPIASREITEVDKGVEITLDIHGDRGARLGWSCAPHRGPGELRALGMPLAGIKWQPASKCSTPKPGGQASPPPCAV